MNALTAGDFTAAKEPFELFESWFSDAKASEVNDPNAMAIASVDQSGLPNVRMVLLNGYDRSGFVFYTNSQSQKGNELDATPKAAAVFHWKSLRRQIRIRGPVEMVSPQEADDYYNSRPRDSRIGAWASQQSRPLESRFALEKAVAKQVAKFGLGDIPRPPHWNGYRICPTYFEFWHDRPFRLHDRVVFKRSDLQGLWTSERWYP